MANPPRSLQDLVRRRQQAGFVGREGELAFFRDNLDLPVEDERRRLLFSIHGDGGMGKSFLIGRLKDVARERGRLIAGVDENAFGVVEVMEGIAAHLDQQGVKLKRFSRELETYRKRRHETDLGSEDGVAATLTKAATKITTGAVETFVPGGNLIGKAIDPDQVNHLRAAAVDRLRKRDDARLVASPVDELTPAFLEGLRDADKPLALFFDTYERTGVYLDDWLRAILDGRYGDAPLEMIVTVAGRRPLDPHRWAPYLGVVADLPLVAFTEVEVRQLLAQKSVTDETVIDVIRAVSGGLPLGVAMLAEQRPSAPDAVKDPSGGLVDRFLQWEQDQEKRDFALAAALPRRLDQDVVAVLVDDGADPAELYGWLHAQSFVSSTSGRCQYHDVVREPMIRLARGRSRQRWEQSHRRLAEFYRERRTGMGLSGKSGWADRDWEGRLREESYHLLCADPASGLPEVLPRVIRATMENMATARGWAETIAAAGRDADADRLVRLARVLQRSVAETGDLVGFLDTALRHPAFPDDGRAHAYQHRGVLLRNAERYNEALHDFTRAITLDPALKRAIAGRGDTYRLAERYEDALADLTRAICLEPDETWLLIRRGMTYNALRRHDEAVADYSRAVELDPDDAWSFAQRGMTYLKLERREEALADLTAAIRLKPDYEWAIANRANAYRHLGRYDDALVDFNRAIQLEPEDTWNLRHRGMTYHALGRHEETLADFNRAIQLDPDDPWDLTYRGLTYQALGRHEEALADLTAAIRLKPDYEWAIANRAETYRRLRRYDDALTDFDEAIRLRPDNAWAIGNRANTYRLLGRHHNALTDFNRAIQLDPDDPWDLTYRGLTYQALGRHDEALTDFTEAIRLKPDYEWAIANRADIYQHLGRYDDALADFDRAIQLDPDNTWNLGHRGLTYQSLGRREEALADFDRAIQLDPDNTWALGHRGVTYRSLGRREEALADFDRALELAPYDDSFALERFMTCGVALPTEHGYQWVADVEATEAESGDLVGSVREWLVSAGMVSPDVAGFRFEAKGVHLWRDADGPGHRPSGVAFHSGRMICSPEKGESVTCPGCGDRTVLRADRVAASEWDEFVLPIYDWPSGRRPERTCRSCGEHRPLSEWHIEEPWAFAHVAVRFWNRPPLTAEFLDALSARLGGHRLVVLSGHR
ncbi:tetratricopeptide repeat protein [Microtetraspora malaysiensis]|uniref:tetratricopeptide repeat protein n=1 Tax=Microtetraspora malaysiensis TaxID=161358 RepID=UPI003D9144D9